MFNSLSDAELGMAIVYLLMLVDIVVAAGCARASAGKDRVTSCYGEESTRR